MNDLDVCILESIIELQGKCLSELCQVCPFKSRCLPKFLTSPPSAQSRLNMAMSAITDNALSPDGIDLSEYNLDDEQKTNERRDKNTVGDGT